MTPPPPRYVTRYRMERAIPDDPPPARLPGGFAWLAWADILADRHADVIYAAFAGTYDVALFPNLGSSEGCRRMLDCTRTADGFCPAASWLVVVPGGCIGAVQGIVTDDLGMIQNVGVVPAYRGRGIGKALVMKAVRGFARCGARTVGLDVTARNGAAVRVYERAGFRRVKVMYRNLDLVAAGLGAGI